MKRFLALFLSIIMLVTLLAACASSNETDEVPANVANQNRDAPEEDNSEEDTRSSDDDRIIPSAHGGVSVTPAGELPIVKEPVPLSILIAQHENVEDYDD